MMRAGLPMTMPVEVEWLISQLPEQLRTPELRQALMAPGIGPLWQRMGTLINAQESTGAIGTVLGSVTQHNADVSGDYAARDVIKSSIFMPIIIAGPGLAGRRVDDEAEARRRLAFGVRHQAFGAPAGRDVGFGLRSRRPLLPFVDTLHGSG